MSSIFLRKKKQLLPAPDSPRLLRRWRPGSEADMIWFRCRLILALYLIYVWIYIDLYCVCIYIYILDLYGFITSFNSLIYWLSPIFHSQGRPLLCPFEPQDFLMFWVIQPHLHGCSDVFTSGITQIFPSGWWYTYPSEKYESQLGRILPYIMENKIHVWNHQPAICFSMFLAIQPDSPCVSISHSTGHCHSLPGGSWIFLRFFRGSFSHSTVGRSHWFRFSWIWYV